MIRWFLMLALLPFLSQAEPITKKGSVTAFVESWSGMKGVEFKEGRFDLNGDGKAEAVVYLRSKEHCGTGGCNLLVLTPTKNGWKLVSEIRPVKLPIWALETKTDGWLDISVNVSGSGIRDKVEVMMRHTGRGYPENPITEPSRNGFNAETDRLILSDW